MKKLVLIDGNNWGFAGMANPKLSAGERDTQAIFNVMKKIRFAYEDYPDATIMVLWDGRSWRYEHYPEYKGNRTKDEKQLAAREAYKIQRKEIVKGLRYLGVSQISATNMEADDLAEMLTKNAVAKRVPVILLTADEDWQQLVQPGVGWFDKMRNKQCRYQTFKDDTGFKDSPQFIEAKCILGDTGDNIKGIKGIGDKALENLYTIYPSIHHFFYEIRTYGRETVIGIWKERIGKLMPKVLREIDIEETERQLAFNMSMVDLSTDVRPKPYQLKNDKQPFNKDAFEEFCYANAFSSITRDFDEFIRPFQERN